MYRNPIDTSLLVIVYKYFYRNSIAMSSSQKCPQLTAAAEHQTQVGAGQVSLREKKVSLRVAMPYSGSQDGKRLSEQKMGEKILASVSTRQLFDLPECRHIEQEIEDIVRAGKQGMYKKQTVDRAPLRTN